MYYEMPSWPTPWFIPNYRIKVKVSTKNSVQLELIETYPNLEHSNLF